MKPAVVLSAALVAAVVHPGAHGATWSATLSGGGIHQVTADNLPITWSGQVTVVTDGAQDGTYTGDTLESITVDTDVFDWSYTKGQVQTAWEFLPGQFLLVGPEAGASVDITGGRLAGLSLVYDDQFNVDTMSGLAVSAQSECRILICHGSPDNYVVSGTLTPLAAPVPEPATPMLLVAGLGLLGGALRRCAR